MKIKNYSASIYDENTKNGASESFAAYLIYAPIEIVCEKLCKKR